MEVLEGTTKKSSWVLKGLLFLLLVGIGYQVFAQWQLQQSVSLLKEKLSTTNDTISLLSSSTERTLEETDLRLVELSDILYNEQQRWITLEDNLSDFDREVGKLSGSVENLEKLSTTDPELLQKYSKVYFLNEHYMPADLTVIDEEYDLPNGKEVSVHSEVWPFLEDLLDEAKEDGVDLMILSGYRSFAEQATLKETYTVRYGLGANQFSADQGYSEHQLGTTVDFTTPVIGENLTAFEGTEAFAWLQKNAHRYGFTLSYPENNEYYLYEPWHWRFVGRDLARYLDRKNMSFYEMEQRKIDEYIPELFD